MSKIIIATKVFLNLNRTRPKSEEEELILHPGVPPLTISLSKQ
jgi:hypothetical protein